MGINNINTSDYKVYNFDVIKSKKSYIVDEYNNSSYGDKSKNDKKSFKDNPLEYPDSQYIYDQIIKNYTTLYKTNNKYNDKIREIEGIGNKYFENKINPDDIFFDNIDTLGNNVINDLKKVDIGNSDQDGEVNENKIQEIFNNYINNKSDEDLFYRLFFNEDNQIKRYASRKVIDKVIKEIINQK